MMLGSGLYPTFSFISHRFVSKKSNHIGIIKQFSNSNYQSNHSNPDVYLFLYFFSCQNNSRFQIHHDRRIVLRALKNISRGEEITTIYLSPLMGNVLR